MPLYEYRCKKCGHHFEKIQSFRAPDEKECPVCGGAVERLISAPAIRFKGSGWYATDYAGKNESSMPSSHSSEAAENGKATTTPASQASKPAAVSSGSSTAAATSSKHE